MQIEKYQNEKKKRTSKSKSKTNEDMTKKEADAPKNAKDAKKSLLLRGRVVKGIITDKIALRKTF
jgi:hypothetical protein